MIPLAHRRAIELADPARLVELSDTGHFELINPRSKQWPQIVEIVTALR